MPVHIGSFLLFQTVFSAFSSSLQIDPVRAGSCNWSCKNRAVNHAKYAQLTTVSDLHIGNFVCTILL
jgi:hypothetical protein